MKKKWRFCETLSFHMNFFSACFGMKCKIDLVHEIYFLFNGWILIVLRASKRPTEKKFELCCLYIWFYDVIIRVVCVIGDMCRTSVKAIFVGFHIGNIGSSNAIVNFYVYLFFLQIIAIYRCQSKKCSHQFIAYTHCRTFYLWFLENKKRV